MPRITDAILVEAIGLPPEQAIAHFKNLGWEITWDWRESARAARSQSFTVAKAAKMDVLQDIREATQKAISEGTTLRDFIKELEPKLRAKGWWGKQVVQGPNGLETVQLGSPWRLQTIFRTNVQSAYMAGRRKAQEENKGSRPYLMYIAVLDGSTRPSHATMNGKIFHINDPIWNTWSVPAGYSCRCRTRALTEEQAKERGITTEIPDVDPDEGFGRNPANVDWKPDTRNYSPDIRKAAKDWDAVLKERELVPA